MTITAAPRPAARQRILDTARTLFYGHGIRAVGIDRVITAANVAKATFYHHFPTKDDLVCAYLQEQSRMQREMAQRIRSGEAPARDRLIRVFEAIGDIGCGPEFRGCSFINAAAEYPDPEHPVRKVVADHRRWFRGLVEDLLSEMGHPDVASTATMLILLRDGIVVGSDLDDSAAIRKVTRTAVTCILAAPSEPAEIEG